MNLFLRRVGCLWNSPYGFCVAVELARREYPVDDALTYTDILWLLTRKKYARRATFPEPAAILLMMQHNGW